MVVKGIAVFSPFSSNGVHVSPRSRDTDWRIFPKPSKTNSRSTLSYLAPVNIALVFCAAIAYNVNKLCLWI